MPAYIVRYPKEALKYEADPIPQAITTGVFVEKIIMGEGGFHVYYKGHPFPGKGLGEPDRLQAVDQVKKYIKSFLKISSPLKLLFSKKYRAKVLYEFNDFAYTTLRPYFLKPVYYSRAIKELSRLGQFIPSSEIAIDAICVVLQIDKPYCARFQDAFQLINPIEWQKHPARGIYKLFKTLEERDHQRQHWERIGKLAYLGTLLHPGFRGIIKRIGKEINPQEFQFDAIDLYYNLDNDTPSTNGEFSGGYDIMGLDREKRRELLKSIINEPKIRDVSANL